MFPERSLYNMIWTIGLRYYASIHSSSGIFWTHCIPNLCVYTATFTNLLI